MTRKGFGDWSRRTALLVILLGGVVVGMGCETAHIVRDRGLAAREAGNHQAAQQYLEEAVDRDPTDYRSQYYLGLTYLEVGRPARAQIVLERALELRPNDQRVTPLILDNLAEAYYQQERYSRLQEFLRNQAVSSGTTHDLLREGEYLMKIGDLDGAKVAYTRAGLFAEANDARPYIALATFYESINDLENAEQALRWAAYVEPNNPEVANRLRGLDVVPGPTVRERPPRSPEELMQRTR